LIFHAVPSTVHTGSHTFTRFPHLTPLFPLVPPAAVPLAAFRDKPNRLAECSFGLHLRIASFCRCAWEKLPSSGRNQPEEQEPLHNAPKRDRAPNFRTHRTLRIGSQNALQGARALPAPSTHSPRLHVSCINLAT
ncbi:MAG: hypothetical protein Q9173_003095, partial [Seirophora scorigena]